VERSASAQCRAVSAEPGAAASRGCGARAWSSPRRRASPAGPAGVRPLPIPLPWGSVRETLRDTGPRAPAAGDESGASPPATTLAPSPRSGRVEDNTHLQRAGPEEEDRKGRVLGGENKRIFVKLECQSCFTQRVCDSLHAGQAQPGADGAGGGWFWETPWV